MKEIIIDSILQYLPYLIGLIFTIITGVVSKKVIPVLTTTKNAKMLVEVIEFAKILVDSAQRLDKTGKLIEVTKKDYVMQQLNDYIEEKGYKFTEEQLDNIRRAAVLALEQTEAIINDAMQQIDESVKNEQLVVE
jgi:hypothetical protein